MHRCTVHGMETTWSIWIRFSTLLSIGLFSGNICMLFTCNAEADGKNHGLPSMSRRSSRRSSLPFFETKSQKPCFSIGSICIQKIGGIYSSSCPNDSDIFRPYWAMGLPNYAPQACLAARLLTEQTRRSLLPEEVTQQGREKPKQDPIGFKRSWPLPFWHIFVQVQWIESRDTLCQNIQDMWFCLRKTEVNRVESPFIQFREGCDPKSWETSS